MANRSGSKGKSFARPIRFQPPAEGSVCEAALAEANGVAAALLRARWQQEKDLIQQIRQAKEEIDRLVLLAGGGYAPPEQMKGRKLFVVCRDDRLAVGGRDGQILERCLPLLHRLVDPIGTWSMLWTPIQTSCRSNGAKVW